MATSASDQKIVDLMNGKKPEFAAEPEPTPETDAGEAQAPSAVTELSALREQLAKSQDSLGRAERLTRTHQRKRDTTHEDYKKLKTELDEMKASVAAIPAKPSGPNPEEIKERIQKLAEGVASGELSSDEFTRVLNDFHAASGGKISSDVSAMLSERDSTYKKQIDALSRRVESLTSAEARTADEQYLVAEFARYGITGEELVKQGLKVFSAARSDENLASMRESHGGANSQGFREFVVSKLINEFRFNSGDSTQNSSDGDGLTDSGSADGVSRQLVNPHSAASGSVGRKRAPARGSAKTRKRPRSAPALGSTDYLSRRNWNGVEDS